MKCARAYTRPCGSAGMVYRVKKTGGYRSYQSGPDPDPLELVRPVTCSVRPRGPVAVYLTTVHKQ